MTKHLDILFTGPPDASIGSHISILDDAGNTVRLGEWIRVRHDGHEYWSLRIPIVFQPLISLESMELITSKSYVPAADSRPYEARDARESNSHADERRRREEARNRQRASWLECPMCKEAYDPQKDELVKCSICTEDGCTRECVKDGVGGTCATCAAVDEDQRESQRAQRGGPAPSRASSRMTTNDNADMPWDDDGGELLGGDDE